MTSTQEKLNQMARKAISLQGFKLDQDGKPVDLESATREFIKTLASLTPDPKEQAKLLIESWSNKDQMKQLSAMRLEQVGNYIASESTFQSAFFRTVTLGPSDEPYYENLTKQEIRVKALGEDGKPDQVRVVKPHAKTGIPLYMIASDFVRYKTLDIYKGDVSASAKTQFDIAFDLRFKIDRICYDLLNASVANGGCFGAFSTEQGNSNKASRIYLPHSGIVTAHLPTSNKIDLYRAVGHADNPAPVGDSTTLGVKVLQAIMWYADSWANVFPDGRLVPTGEIICPSSDIFQIALEATPSGVAVPQERIKEDISRDGYTMIHYGGYNWKFIADVTIPKKICYPRFNLLPGTFYTKPSMDKEFVNVNEVENWEERAQRRVIGAHIISQHRIRALKIQYTA